MDSTGMGIRGCMDHNHDLFFYFYVSGLFKIFIFRTKSVLYFDDQIKHTRSDWFCYAANNYKFKDKSFEDLCDHNAHVALNYKKFNAYKDWMILKTIYK